MKRSTATSLSTLLLAVLASTAPAAEPAQSDVAAWITEIDGHYFLDDNGNIAEVDLTSSWVNDADLEKLTLAPHLRRIDLSYTWVTDIGLEHLKPLENIEELRLHYAENITDGGIAHIKHWKN